MTRATNQQNRNDHFCCMCNRQMAHGESYWRDDQADIVCDDCMTRTTEQWADYLRQRCQAEGVDCWLQPSEVYGWCAAGVIEDDREENVWAAFVETLQGVSHAQNR